MDMQIKKISSAAWNDVSKRLATDNIFQSLEWLELVAKEFGLRNVFVEIVDTDNNAFLCLQTKDKEAYSNFIGYGGLLSADKLSDDFVDQVISEITLELGVLVKRVKLFPGNVIDIGSKFWRSGSTSLLRLSVGWENRVKKKVRNSLNFATRKGISVRNLDLKELGSFYEIYEQTADRVRSPYRTPISFFKSLFTFTGVNVVGAYLGTDLVAASVFLTINNRAYYWWSASSAQGLKSNANYTVLYTAIKDLEKHGITVLDMASSNNMGIRDFKEQWGTETVLFSCYER
jgi:hypothetical protein